MRSTPPSSETARPSPSASRLPRYAVGIVNYRSYPELERALRSVAGQSGSPTEIVVADLEGGGSVAERLQAEFSPVRWEVLPNVGYAAASNRCLEWLIQAHPGLEFILLLNADVELEPDFVSALLGEMRQVPEAVLGTGKLLRGDARTLDSTGIVLPRNRRPRDRGSEQPDEGQYDRVEFVWGVSGAALMLRLDCLEKLAIEGEVFDEDFFMYHEDTDLAWRAQNFGMRSLYVPAARAIHQRGWKRSSRFERPVALRRHSFKNHYLENCEERVPGRVRYQPTVLRVLGSGTVRLCAVARSGHAPRVSRCVALVGADLEKAKAPAATHARADGRRFSLTGRRGPLQDLERTHLLVPSFSKRMSSISQ